MSIAAVQAWAKTELDGLTSAKYPAAQAWITPLPVWDAAAAPQIYIWTTTVKEQRQTSPRNLSGSGGGFKLLTHTLALYLFAIYDNSASGNDTRFADFVEAVQAKLRTAQVPVVITDPDTSATSQLGEVGETIDVETDVVRSLSNQKLFAWHARVETLAKELIQA